MQSQEILKNYFSLKEYKNLGCVVPMKISQYIIG